jgi:hypothetical protein
LHFIRHHFIDAAYIYYRRPLLEYRALPYSFSRVVLASFLRAASQAEKHYSATRHHRPRSRHCYAFTLHTLILEYYFQAALRHRRQWPGAMPRHRQRPAFPLIAGALENRAASRFISGSAFGLSSYGAAALSAVSMMEKFHFEIYSDASEEE